MHYLASEEAFEQCVKAFNNMICWYECQSCQHADKQVEIWVIILGSQSKILNLTTNTLAEMEKAAGY